MPHTVEEAYELADAADSGDDAKLLDELGDVLFQVYFLSLLLEERGEGSLAEVAEHVREKLIRRHPHVFGDAGGRDGRRRRAQLERDQARGRARASDLRRAAREPAGDALRAQDPAPRRSSAASRAGRTGERRGATIRQHSGRRGCSSSSAEAASAGVDPSSPCARGTIDSGDQEVDGA